VFEDDGFGLPSSSTSSESLSLDSGGVASFFSGFKPPRPPITRRERKPKRARVEEAVSTEGVLEKELPRVTVFERVQAVLLRLKGIFGRSDASYKCRNYRRQNKVVELQSDTY